MKINDVNALRELACEACGVASRLHARYESADDVDAVEYGFAMREAGQLVQHAGDLEAWVTLRKRVEALMGYHDPSSTAVAALQDVIDIMDELEES